ncbi:MAG: ABC transporter permease [Ruminococcus sp.]|nr:ABC transporter permease [Ruminococcus sp.]
MIENIRLSFRGIFSHKIRSLLTMLGIIIGIAAIIAIVSTIKGTNERIKNNLIGSGSNTVKISLKLGGNEYDFTYQSPPSEVVPLTDESRNSIVKLNEVENCTFYRTRNNPMNIFAGTVSLESSTVIGIDKYYFDTAGYMVSEGKSFSESDYTSFSKKAIVDKTLADGTFNGESPIGMTLDISGEPFTVIGVVSEVSEFEPDIESVDDYYTYNQTASGKIFIPTEDWGIVYRYDEPQNCIVKAVDTDSMTGAGKKAADILNKNIIKNTAATGEKTTAPKYKSENLLEQAKSLQDLSSSTNSMLIWIAGISLLVGGIGVMNIMLVSVTERTKEIGLKKALGARRGRILGQFLTEAAVLTSIGGIIGVLTGIGLSKVIAKVAEVPVAISTPAIIIAVVFSMAVGIVFGLIPSIKAARLNPIDALRYE